MASLGFNQAHESTNQSKDKEGAHDRRQFHLPPVSGLDNDTIERLYSPTVQALIKEHPEITNTMGDLFIDVLETISIAVAEYGIEAELREKILALEARALEVEARALEAESKLEKSEKLLKESEALSEKCLAEELKSILATPTETSQGLVDKDMSEKLPAVQKIISTNIFPCSSRLDRSTSSSPKLFHGSNSPNISAMGNSNKLFPATDTSASMKVASTLGSLNSSGLDIFSWQWNGPNVKLPGATNFNNVRADFDNAMSSPFARTTTTAPVGRPVIYSSGRNRQKRTQKNFTKAADTFDENKQENATTRTSVPGSYAIAGGFRNDSNPFKFSGNAFRDSNTLGSLDNNHGFRRNEQILTPTSSSAPEINTGSLNNTMGSGNNEAMTGPSGRPSWKQQARHSQTRFMNATTKQLGGAPNFQGRSTSNIVDQGGMAANMQAGKRQRDLGDVSGSGNAKRVRGEGWGTEDITIKREEEEIYF